MPTSINEPAPGPGTPVGAQLDPALLLWSQHAGPSASASTQGAGPSTRPGPDAEPMIDPALYEMDRAAEDARKGLAKSRSDVVATQGGSDQPGEGAEQDPAAAVGGPGGEAAEGADHAWAPSTLADTVELAADMGHPPLEHGMDEFDPALREIVNSLTNAQQIASGSGTGGGMTPAEAVAALGAHIHEADERERLAHTLQSTLDDISLQALFHQNAHFDPATSYMLGPPAAADDSDPASSLLTPVPTDPSSSAPIKRGRGRPKGSKNKPKSGPAAESIARARKPTPPPPRPKGRPPKLRGPEEQAEYDRRKAERAQGIKRSRGRPRKYPGYLVRDMRLKKNRQEWEQIKRQMTVGGGEPGPATTEETMGPYEDGDSQVDGPPSGKEQEYWDLPGEDRMLVDHPGEWHDDDL